jgi:membrane fusion protein (multidrug efflux system)
MQMNRSVKMVAGLGIVVLFALAGVTGTQALLSVQQTDDGGRASNATRVAVASPEQRRMEDAVTATGTIMPVRAVELVPNAPGRVTGVPVSSGQQVAAGDLLIQLDDRAARAALADAEATLREAQQAYTRIERLAESNAAAESRLESARADLHRAEAAVMAADADLEDRTITAPFDGTLGVIDIDEGAYLDGTTPVTRLSDLSSVEVSASLPERYFESVKPGQTLQVTTPAYPGETFEGRITLRAPEIDRDTRSFEMRAEIANPDRRLAGGMFARSRLLLGSYDGVAIPAAAIISEGLKSYVYTVADGTATRIDIDPGKSLGELTEVRGGMALGDRVVVAGWDQLSDGAAVSVEGDGAQEATE